MYRTSSLPWLYTGDTCVCLQQIPGKYTHHYFESLIRQKKHLLYISQVGTEALLVTLGYNFFRKHKKMGTKKLKNVRSGETAYFKVIFQGKSKGCSCIGRKP